MTKRVALLGALGACDGSRSGAADAGLGGTSGGTMGGVAGNAGAAGGGGGPSDTCDCRIEDGTLVMSWDCFCQRYGCSAPATCIGERFDYPTCGLSVRGRGLSNFISVVDSSGALVGTQATSDTSPYTCPTNAALTALRVRAGRWPEASCREVACGACSTTVPFPCAGDGGASD